MKKLIILLPLFLFSTGMFGQNFQELPDSLDINASRFPLEKVFIENIVKLQKANLKQGNYKINRVIGSIKQNDIFSIDENGLIDGKTEIIRGDRKRIAVIKKSQIIQTEVYNGEDLANKQIFEPFKDSVLVSKILDGNNIIRSKVSRYFTKNENQKTVTTNYDKDGKIVELIDELKNIKIDYDKNGKAAKSTENIDGQTVEKAYEDGILKAKKYSENGKNIEEYYENGKLIEKEISYIKDFKFYTETYKNGKLINRTVSEVEEKKAY